MEGLRPRERLVAQHRQCTAASGVLHAGPGERGIEVVAAVHENRSGLDAVADVDGGFFVFRPDGGGQAEIGVVHQRDRFFVGIDGHNSYSRAERLLSNNAHTMRSVSYTHLTLPTSDLV